MKRSILALAFALLACSRGGGMGNDDALFNSGEVVTPLKPGIQRVRIGEGGPAFDACSALGRVVNISASGESYLPVRAAPFAEADEVGRLGDGATLHVCARSIDQRWLGVVVPPTGHPEQDCGVSAPVATPRAYAGPCEAGWVASAFVRLVAS